MRLATVILMISLLQVSAATVAQNLTYAHKKTSITQIIKEIRKQTGLNVMASVDNLKNIPSLDVNFKNTPVADVLNTYLAGQPLTFEMDNKLILIKEKPASVLDKIKAALAIPIIVTGKVTDTTGAPIRGVSIKVKGNNLSTITNENGDFHISVSENDILIFSSIGYQTISIPVNERGIHLIVLRHSTSKLDEVQVIAYGTISQRLNTGSVTKVTSTEIMSQPISNPLAALQGRVAGLTVTQSNGLPGSPFRVELRGQNGLATSGGAGARDFNSDPLFIIDGIPFAPNNGVINTVTSALNGASTTGGLSPFSTINPADIESIEVLKDADATAIYGSRGGNGVILITTKKGKAGRTKLSANVYTGVSKDSHIPQMLNTDQYIQMRKQAFKNDGTTPNTTNAPDLLVFDNNRYTNFAQNFLGGNASVTDAQVSLSGGTENTTFLLAGGYHQEGTVYPGNLGANRASVHVNLNNASADRKFHTVFSASYAHEQNNLIASNLPGEISLPPNLPALMDNSGNLLWSYNGVSFDNPLAYLKYKYNASTDNLISSLSLSYQIIKGFSFKSDFGYNKITVGETETFPISAQNPLYSPLGSATFGTNNFSGWNIEPQLTYETKLSKGKLNALIGGTWQYNKNDNTTILASGYVNDALLESVGAAASLYTTNNFYEYKYQAFFGRVNYNWDDRYLLNLTARRDGSSRFGANRQFSNFGAIGAAWLFNNESFFKKLDPILSYGKLRGSYGITGTDQIGNYQYLDSWSVTNNTYQATSGLYPTRLANADYSWEKNRKLEFGLELGFLRDRFLLTTSYFRNTSDNHLINYAEPSQTGFTSITRNFPAVIRNTGWEFTLTTRNVIGAVFNWSTSANITFQQNKLVSFPNLASSSYASVYQEGQSLDMIQGYQYLGVDPATGSFKFKDQNNDGLYNSKDFINLGNLNPPFYGGISNTFNYRNFNLDFFFEFKKQLGRNYLNYIYNGFSYPGSQQNLPIALLARWQSPGDQTSFAKFTTGNTGAALFNGYNSYLISDASYVRLKSLSFGYNLPVSWIKKLHVQSLKVYAQASNLFTITGFKVTDPETQSLVELPPLRTITAGIQLSL